MGEKQLFQKVQTYLKEHGNALKLASGLGYSTSSTIAAWINNGKIPKHKQGEVERYFKDLEKEKK